MEGLERTPGDLFWLRESKLGYKGGDGRWQRSKTIFSLRQKYRKPMNHLPRDNTWIVFPHKIMQRWRAEWGKKRGWLRDNTLQNSHTKLDSEWETFSKECTEKVIKVSRGKGEHLPRRHRAKRSGTWSIVFIADLQVERIKTYDLKCNSHNDLEVCILQGETVSEATQWDHTTQSQTPLPCLLPCPWHYCPSLQCTRHLHLLLFS